MRHGALAACLALAPALWLAPRPAAAAGDAAGTATPAFAHGEPQIAALQVLLAELARPPAPAAAEAARARLREAVLAHPEARAGLAGRDAAQMAARELESALWPQMQAEVQAGRLDNQRSTLLPSPARAYDTGSVTLSVRQRVYDFGATGLAATAGRERAGAVAARADNRRIDLALRAVQAALGLQRARRQQALADANAAALDAMVEALQRRHALGGGPLADVWRAQAQAAQARAARAAAASAVAAAESVAAEVFGPGTAADDALAAAVMPPPPASWPDTPPAMLRAVDAFPAVRSADAAWRASQVDRDAASRRELPRLDLELSARARDLARDGEPGTDVLGQLVLRWDFFTGGGDGARTGQATARAVEAAEQVQQIRRQVERALRQALAEREAGLAVRTDREAAVRLAIESLRGVREQFAARRGSLLDLLSTQATLHQAGTALVDAEHDLAVAGWRLFHLADDLLAWLGLPSASSAPDPADRSTADEP